jgi:hypothetical protein
VRTVSKEQAVTPPATSTLGPPHPAELERI